MLKPAHPGQFVRSEVLEAHQLSVREAAEILGVTRQTLSILLNGHASLTPEMALRIEKAFGVSMDTLVRLQTSYDIAQTRARESEIHVAPYVPKGPTAEQSVLL